MAKQVKLTVKDTTVRIKKINNSDYICLTDIAKSGRSPAGDIIKNYLRNRNNIEFLGLWESLNNQNFNSVDFHRIKTEVGLSDFILSVKEWVNLTNAVGIYSSAGRFGGTFAHIEIATQFATWFNASFYLYFVKEFQRLKTEEAAALNSEWNVRRLIAKTNYHIHSESVRENLVPIIDWNTKREAIYHATEADLLNLALFGMTAREWKQANPKLKGNMRDHATIEQLLVLANLETLNAEYLELKLERNTRLKRLNEVARKQIDIILNTRVGEQLGGGKSLLE